MAAGCLVFFDIDGTLVPGTSSGAFLAERLGHGSTLEVAEAAYAAGMMDNRDVCRVDARGWTGRRRADVLEWLAELPLVDGIPETLAWCRRRGITPVLASLAWTVVGETLASRFGFAGHCGPTLVTRGGMFTGEVASGFDELGKRDFALDFASARGVGTTHCAAIGDSRSDLPLFGVVGLSVAFNADEQARGTATTTVDSPDLRELVPVLERWVDSLS